jgi:hypothetical protein
MPILVQKLHMAAYKRLQSLPFHWDANNSAKNHKHITFSLSQIKGIKSQNFTRTRWRFEQSSNPNRISTTQSTPIRIEFLINSTIQQQFSSENESNSLKSTSIATRFNKFNTFEGGSQRFAKESSSLNHSLCNSSTNSPLKRWIMRSQRRVEKRRDRRKVWSEKTKRKIQQNQNKVQFELIWNPRVSNQASKALRICKRIKAVRVRTSSENQKTKKESLNPRQEFNCCELFRYRSSSLQYDSCKIT